MMQNFVVYDAEFMIKLYDSQLNRHNFFQIFMSLPHGFAPFFILKTLIFGHLTTQINPECLPEPLFRQMNSPAFYWNGTESITGEKCPGKAKKTRTGSGLVK